MNLKKCGCKYCRVGMRSKGEGDMIRHSRKGARRQAKMDLLKGKEPKTYVRIPYTD
jgi:hypothetical protein